VSSPGLRVCHAAHRTAHGASSFIVAETMGES
jgi:hypothetical protein